MSLGRSALPPSQPQAAASEAVPPARPRRSKARRSSFGSVMTRESPSVPAAQHCAERGRVHDEHQDHVDDTEGHERPHDPEMPIARQLKAAEQGGEPTQLRRLVDGQTGEDPPHPPHDDPPGTELLHRPVASLPPARLSPTQRPTPSSP